MWTDIQERVQLALEISHQNRRVQDFAGEKVSWSCEIVDRPQRVPGCFEKVPLFRAELFLGIILIWPQEMPKVVLVDEHGVRLGELNSFD
jgi:hypothetical protein